MPVTLNPAPEVDTLRAVSDAPTPDPEVFGTDALAERWAVSRQYVNRLAKEDPSFPKATPVGSARGTGTWAWSRAQIHAWEVAHAAWVSEAPQRRADAVLRRSQPRAPRE